MTAITVFGSERCTLEISQADGSFIVVPGVSGYDESGGDAPRRDSITFEGATQLTGHARPAEVSFEGKIIPTHPAWQRLREVFGDGSVIQVRLTTDEREILDPSGTIAIATTGIVTLAGNGAPVLKKDRFAPGMAFKVGTSSKTVYTITSISDNNVATVAPKPAAQVAATENYTIVVPSIRRGPFDATVTLADRVSLASEGDMETTVQLSPTASQLPEWTAVAA